MGENGIMSGLWSAVAQSVGYGSQALNPILLHDTGVDVVQDQQALNQQSIAAQQALDAQAANDATMIKIAIVAGILIFTLVVVSIVLKKK